MRALDERFRRRLLTVSAMLCAIPVLLAPIAGRSSFELASEQAAFNARFSTPRIFSAWNDTPIAVERDPFIADAGADIDKAVPGSGVTGMQIVQGESMGFTVPGNDSASEAAVTVRAIATGISPHALIEENARARVVGLGDVIAGSPVIAIAQSGVRLKNGTLLTLTGEHQ